MKLSKFINYTSLRFRINIVYAFFNFIIITSIAAGIGLVSNSLLKQESETNLNQNISLAAERLDALLDKIENASLHFVVTEAYKETYETGDDWTSYEDFLFTSSITSHLLEFLSVQKDIYSMAFFTYDGKSFYRAFDEASAFNSSSGQDELLAQFIDDDKPCHWYVNASSKYDAMAELVFFRKLYDLNGKLRGILSLTLSNTSLNQLIAPEMASSGAFAMVFKQPGFDPIQLSSVPFEPGNTSQLTVRQEYSRIPCFIATQVSKASVYKNSYILVASIFFIGISICLLSMYFLFSSTKHFLSPLEKIIKTVHELSKGDYSARVHSTLNDELGTLSRQIDQMAENTQSLMKQIEDTGERKTEYEVAYLQMQMRPHFLYNTLETLCGMITVHENDHAVALIHDISRFYRAVLSNGNSIITLRKELEISEDYMKIMNTRYHGIFTCSVDVSQDTLDATIPKLTLQPLIENSIIHGFVASQRSGHIQITGEKKGDFISLSINDNGCGITQEKLDFLRGESQAPQKTAFGIRNIEERLRLYMGNSCTIIIDSDGVSGTKIHILFPYKEGVHVLPISDC